MPLEWTRGRFDPSEWIRPQYRRLAMGFVHAVAILLTINREALLQTARLFRAEASLGLLNDTKDWTEGVLLFCAQRSGLCSRG